MTIFRKIKKNTLVEIIAGLFILLFVYTSISKLADINNFRYVLSKSPLISDYALIVAWSIPIVELIVSVLLFFPRTRKWGLLSSLVLMIGFTGYLSYMIYSTPNLPCSCGGVIGYMSWQQHLVFNIVFTLLALAAIWMDGKNKRGYNNNQNAIEPTYSPA